MRKQPLIKTRALSDTSDIKEGSVSLKRDGQDLYLYTKDNAQLYKVKLSKDEIIDNITEKEQSRRLLRTQSQRVIRPFTAQINGSIRLAGTDYWWENGGNSDISETATNTTTAIRATQLQWKSPQEALITSYNIHYYFTVSYSGIQVKIIPQVVRKTADGATGNVTDIVDINNASTTSTSYVADTAYYREPSVSASAKGSAFATNKLNAGDGLRILFRKASGSTGYVYYSAVISGEYI